MRISTIVLVILVCFCAQAQADTFEVLVVGTAAEEDTLKVKEFEKDAEKLNGLHRRGYAAARPYFNVLRMSNGRVYLVFGFRGEVQGIHRRNYPATVKNLRRMKIDGKPKYPDMHWLPVAEIRGLLKKP